VKLYAPVTDIVRNERVGYVIQNGSSSITYGITDTTEAWAYSYNNGFSKSLTDDLPLHMQIGEFGVLTKSIESILAAHNAGLTSTIPDSVQLRLVSSEWTQNESFGPAVKDIRLSDFEPEIKNLAVMYKASAFINDSKRSSVLLKSRLSHAGISDACNGFKTRPGYNSSDDTEFVNIVGNTSGLRRAAKDVMAVKSELLFNHPGYHVKETESLNNDSVELKALAGTIGRRGRSAMRFTNARFDPKAIDGDSDGLVQEGTAFQRPGLPNVPKIPTGDLRSRQRAAVNERAGSLRGLASARKIKRSSADAPGKYATSETDGQLFDAMTPDQQSKVKSSADKEHERIVRAMAKSNPSWWRGFVLDRRQGMDENAPDYFSIRDGADFLHLQSYFDQVVTGRLKDAKNEQTELLKWKRNLDNLQTLSAMRRNDKYELLEHLHPTARKNVAKDIDPTIKVGNQESSIFKAAGGFDKSKLAEVVEGREAVGLGKVRRRVDESQRSLSDRILTPNPERQRRRELRKQRRSGVLRRSGQADVERERTLGERIARAKRNTLRKFRKQRTQGDIRKAMMKDRQDHPLKRDGAGAPVVDKPFVDFIAFVGKGIDARRSGDAQTVSNNDVLLDSWENAGFNDLPVQISDDEMQHLQDNGWTFAFRGMGHQKGIETKENNDGSWSVKGSKRKFKTDDEAKKYGEQAYIPYSYSYLEDSDRFVPGQGGSAHGVGEYWAPAESGHFGGYGGGIVGMVDPEARKIDITELSKIKSDHANINNEIRRVLTEYPDSKTASQEDPKVFADKVRDALKAAQADGLLQTSEMGKITSQLLAMYENSSDGDRPNIWQTIQMLGSMDRHDSGHYAPLLGYDYITHGSQVVTLHNRGSVAVFPEPLTVPEARAVRDKITGRTGRA